MSTENPAVKKSLLTPFNVMVGIILLIGAVITVLRFTKGLGGVTNLSDNNPWGIWISFDLLCGVALAAGGYTTSAACYVFGLKRYHSAVRPAILTAFLGYCPGGLRPASTTWAGPGGCPIPSSCSPAPPRCSSKWACASCSI